LNDKRCDRWKRSEFLLPRICADDADQKLLKIRVIRVYLRHNSGVPKKVWWPEGRPVVLKSCPLERPISSRLETDFRLSPLYFYLEGPAQLPPRGCQQAAGFFGRNVTARRDDRRFQFAIAAGELLLANENWPQWRGPNGNGTSDSKNLPTTWDAESGKNIVWKTELPAWSGSSPVIWGDYVFVASPSKSDGNAPPPQESGTKKAPPDGKNAGGKGFGGKGGPPGGGKRPTRDPGGQTLLLICLSKQDGSVRWQREIDQGNRTYNKQNSSSPSPVTDGKHVWIMTGNGVLTAFDFSGKQLWKKDLQSEYGKFGLNWGYGSSPLLYDGKLIVEVLHGMRTDEPSYLVAFDDETGKVIWRKDRPTDAPNESPDSYTTPTLVTVNGKPQIVVSGGDYVTGHDPATGEELWRAGGLNPNKDGFFRTVNSPVVADGMIYAGTRQKPVLALKAGGSGDVS
jgi:outer membrane protein assembly factor BamB